MNPKVTVPRTLPVIPLRSTIVFPTSVLGLQMGVPENIEALGANPDDPLLVGLVVAPGEPDEPIDPRSLEKVGVLARLSDRLNLPGGTLQVTAQGLRRIHISNVKRNDGFVGNARLARESQPEPEAADELISRVLTDLEMIAARIERVPTEVPAVLRMNVADPGRFADLVAVLTNFSLSGKDQVVQELDVGNRLAMIADELDRQVARIREVQEPESERAREEEAEASSVDRATRIRRQIEQLQAELGQVDPTERQAVELLRRIESSDLPPQAANRARLEVERLRAFRIDSMEAGEIRTYIETLLALPWTREDGTPPAKLDLKRIRRDLDRALLGLDEPKTRLIDYLAVAKLRGDLRGPIPCIVGPPEVGKTTLARVLAKSLRREAHCVELGGKDEHQLIGERRSRPGAEPGRLMAVLRDADARDPVIVLEDLDLIGLGKVDGDPLAAIEQAVRWQTRTEFVDRYLDVPFDLSRVLFLATARDFSRIPTDLRDHVVEIRIAGYTPEEKVRIARRKLLPELVEENGLEADDVRFTDGELYFIARGYARDSGVGLMRRDLSTLLRTRARAKAHGEEGRWEYTEERIQEILGSPRYTATVAESAPEVGVVTGLAWTAAGGELMFIEALKMPGTGRLQITGSLGDVMRESVNAAYSYARSRASELGISPDSFREFDVHVHFPEGAVPKDGPSAGIAVTLAIASSLSGRPVRHDVAMTGEVTLRGKVLEVGGIKEKVLAAYRAGLRTVILPAGNERDLREVPDDAREKTIFHFVERLDDVMPLALLPTSDEAEQPDRWRRERQRRQGVTREVARPRREPRPDARGEPRNPSEEGPGAMPGHRPGRSPGRKPGEG